jgi:hypothetical protein
MSDTYIPADIQSGLPSDVPLKINTDTDNRLNSLFNPALTQKDIPTPTTNFSDFFNSSDKVQSGIPKGMSFEDAFFSTDPKIKGIANSIMEGEKNKDAYTKFGIGQDIRTPYDQASKYLNGEFGFDYRRDNEDYYAQFKNAGVTGVAENIGKFLGRTAGSAILKLGQGFAGLLAMGTAPFQDGNYWTNVSDNVLVQGLSHAEDYLKDQLLPVYQNASARNMGVFHRMVSDNTFWTSDVSDGLAFMLSALVPGAAESKLGFAANLGAETEIAGLSAATKALRLGRTTAQGLDKLAATTLNTVTEAFFEGKGVHDGVMKKYSDFTKSDPDEIVTLPNGQNKRAADLTNSEKEDIASTGARNDFLANIPILMFSNAFETKLLYKALGKELPKAGRALDNLFINKTLGAELEAAGKAGKYSSLYNKIGFYGKHAAEGVFWEGLWEENAQLAAQRLNDDSVKYDHDSNFFTNFYQQLFKQTRNAARDASDPLYDKEAASSIGLGALIGLGGGAGVSLATSEYSKGLKNDKLIQEATVARINNARDAFLSPDIFQKDENGNFAFKNGKPVVDNNKILAIASKMNDIADKAASVETLRNPEMREVETKRAFIDYVNAISLAGKRNQLLNRLNDLDNASPQQLAQLGFDANQQIADPANMAAFAKTLYGIHDRVKNMNLGAQPKGTTAESFADVNQQRRTAIYKSLAYSNVHDDLAKKYAAEYEAFKTIVKVPGNMAATDNFVDQYNLLQDRKASNIDTALGTKDSPIYLAALEDLNKTLDNQIAELQKNDYYTSNDYFKTIKKRKDGKLTYESKDLDQSMRDSESFSQPLVQHLNSAEIHTIIANKIADPKTGLEYFAPTLKEKAVQAEQAVAKQTTVEPVKTATQTPTATQTAPLNEDASPVPTAQGPTLTQGGFQTIQNGAEFQVVAPDGTVHSTAPSEDEARATAVRLNKEAFKTAAEDAKKTITPPVQDEDIVEAENDNIIQDTLEQLDEENTEFGKKITNSLSLATKVVKYNKETKTGVFDELGRPEYNPNQDNIIDAGVIVPGSVLSIQFDRKESNASIFADGTQKTVAQLFKEGDLNEENQDNAAIKITFKDPSGHIRTLGYMHTLQGARRLLASNTNVDEEIAKLKEVRAVMIANPETSYEVKVTKTGFGFINKGDKRGYKTIDEATDNDKKTVVAIKKGSTFISEGGLEIPTKFGQKIQDGASVILTPNNYNGTEIMVPSYIVKKSVSTDPKIAQVVTDGITKFLSSGDISQLNAMKDFVYITDKPLVGQTLTNNGLYLNKKTNQLVFKGNDINNIPLSQLLSQLLVNLNESALKNANYVKTVRNSPAFQTNIFAQTRGKEKSYFSQHTIEFDNPTPKGVAPIKIVEKQAPVLAGDILTKEPAKTTVENVVAPKKSLEEILDELNNGYGEDGYAFEEGPIISNDISTEAIDNINNQESTLLIPGFSSFLQQEAIKSIAYVALTNTGLEILDKLEETFSGTKMPESVSSAINSRIADIEKRRQEELKRYDERDIRSVESINPNAKSTKNTDIKVGKKYNEGFNVIVRNVINDDSYSGKDDDYPIISKVISPAEFDSDGKMSKAAEIEVTIFNNKEDADESIKNRLKKVESSVGKKQIKINAKYDAEIAALNTPEQDEYLHDEKRDDRFENYTDEAGKIRTAAHEVGIGYGNVPIRIVRSNALDIANTLFNSQTNQESVKKQLINRLAKIRNLNQATKQTAIDNDLEEQILESSRYKESVKIENNLNKVIENYDQLFERATQALNNLGINPDEDTYYTDVLDYSGDTKAFDDESEMQKNHFDSLSKEVKKFISFLPEKIEKDNVSKTKINKIGLPVIADAKQTYTLALNSLSEAYFDRTFDGFTDMLDRLSKHPNATVAQMADSIRKSQNITLKFQFFTNMTKFKTNHIQQLVSLNKDGVDAINIEANRNQMAKVVLEDMHGYFVQNSPVLDRREDEYGNIIYKVNQTKALGPVSDFKSISKNKASYTEGKTQNGFANGKLLIKGEILTKLASILKDQLGLDISENTIKSLITSKNQNNPEGNPRIGLEKYFWGGGKMLQLMTNESSGEESEVDNQNPFISATTELASIARLEVSKRSVTKSDSFRSNGKNYFPFTRMSYIKGVFQQIQKVFDAQDHELTPDLVDMFTDFFRGRSKTLMNLVNKAQDTSIPEMWFARGVQDKKGKTDNTEIKNANEKEFISTKIHSFQNGGKKEGFFYSDTYSDKVTRFMIKTLKNNIGINSVNNEEFSVDNATLNLFYNYMEGEADRIDNVKRVNQEVAEHFRIPDYHDVNGKEGIGKYFVVFNYLNQKNAPHLYDDNGNFVRNDQTKPFILQEINKQLVQSIKEYRKNLERIEFFKDEKGELSARGLNDTKYYNKIQSKFPDQATEEMKINTITADYVLNSSLNSLEMLTLTGDPALSPKLSRLSNNQLNIDDSIKATLVEASKRNASLNAPFDQGISLNDTYKVMFVKDVKINTEHAKEYAKVLGESKAASYTTGDLTDAQEFTTVFEHLRNLLSVARISPKDLALGLARFDIADFKKNKESLQAKFNAIGVDYNLDNAIRDSQKADLTGMLNPFKPVQRYSRYDTNLGQIIETYIKTSAFPLVPELVKGTDFESYLNQMKEAGADRLDFKTGVKQGIVNPQTLSNEEEDSIIGEENSNVIELKSAAWGEQVYNPEKEGNVVTEGSQQSRLIFVDQDDENIVNYQGNPTTIAQLRQLYKDNHKIILDAKMQDLFKELNIDSIDGINNFTTLKALSDIITKEGLARGYDQNTLRGIELNPSGQFYIPLTYLPNSSQIQSLIAAVISSRILKNKLPGKSFIQGSEVILKTSGKVKVSDDLSLAKNGIIWAKPEYKNTTKLKYLRYEDGEVKPAQVILPFFWRTKDGDNSPLLKSSDFVTKEGFLDLSKIDPELLEINGFRIPYAGLNSGMWFEVAGFLPEWMGDLVLVPGEIAAQMGADYDVDKLFTYVKNHTASAAGIRIDNSSARKKAENDIIDAHKAVYLSKDNMDKVLEPTSTDEIEEATRALEELLPPDNKVPTIYDPAHQDAIWLSNRAGQIAVGVSANFNTLHALAQQSNLFVKGSSVKFLDKKGNLYNDDDLENSVNKASEDTYSWIDGEDTLNIKDIDGVNRLDRVTLIDNPKVTISSVIGNWLQASVDNAKLQILGRAGINRYNLNTALTIISHGFDSKWAINFVNQPILKEYYATIADINDRFSREFVFSQKEVEFDALVEKYKKKAKLDKIDPEYKGQSMSSLKEGIESGSFDKMNATEAANQLEILKQYVQLDNISRDLGNISANTKVEVSGLSKSFSEIDETANDIENLNNPDKSSIGNVDKLIDNTVSGLYLKIPAMVSDLFNNADNPIFAFSTPVYQQIREALGIKRAEDVDDLNREFKQFVYTHPDFKIYDDLAKVKKSILFDSQGNDSLVSIWKQLKQKYPNSVLLNQLSNQFKNRDNDPEILTLNNSDEDISLQMKQDFLDFFKSTDPLAVTFANKLATYGLLLANKEYGPSTILKAIPFEVLKGIGFGETLNNINTLLSKPEVFKNFIRQYRQHNPDKIGNFINRDTLANHPDVKPTVVYQTFKGVKNNIPAQFKLPIPTAEFLNKNPEFKRNVIIGINGETDNEWRGYARTFVNDIVGSSLYELQEDGVTYTRIDTLGNKNISEYDFTNPNVRSAFPIQQAALASDKIEDSILPSTTPNESNDYAATFSNITNATDALAQIQDDNSSEDASYKEKSFYELAKVLSSDLNTPITFSDESRGVNGSYLINSNQILIYPEQIRAAKGDLKTNFQSVILHEAIHAKLDRYVIAQSNLDPSKQDQKFKMFKNVWDTYRKNFITEEGKTTIRGIQDSFLKAELFKALYNRHSENLRKKAENDITITSIFENWDKVKQNKTELLSLVYEMQESMKEAHKDHGIGLPANFDMVFKNQNGIQILDNQRVNQIFNFLDKDFREESLGNLKDKYYAYANIREFSPMTLTSQGFQQHLSNIKGIGNSKSLWENVKDFIKKVISSLQNSLLDNAIDAVLDLTLENSQDDNNKGVEPSVSPTTPENTNRSISDQLANQNQSNDLSNKIVQEKLNSCLGGI